MTRAARWTAVVLTLLLAPSPAPAAGANPARKPNVIVFLVDDMGWTDCGVQGSTYYETPNIDRFAARAMRFTSAYAQPLCSPTRASLLTGKYPARHGITTASGHLPPQPAGHKLLADSAPPDQPMLLPESRHYLEPAEYTLAEALHDAGYRTGHIGKWHVGATQPHWPEQQGFDVAFHCHPDPGPPGAYFSPYGVVHAGTPKGQTRVGTITDGPRGEYIVDRLADEAVKFIEANRDRPFFLNLWNYGVHGPWGHKEEYTRGFASKKDPRGLQNNPIMASMLRSVDECFGRVLDAVDRLGLGDDTIIIFNSDNGGNTHSNTPDDPAVQKAAPARKALMADWRKWAGDRGPTNNAPLRDGKASLYEGGTRVPLMWAWAGHIKPGSTDDTVVGHVDLYPTVLDLVGVRRPSRQTIDGASYAPVLLGTGALDRKAFFNYFPHGASPNRAGGVWVRSGDWKLIRWFGAPPGDGRRFELYNLRDDLGEARNLAPDRTARVKELDALIDAFLADTGATYPRPNPAFTRTAALPSLDPLEGWKARGCDAVVAGGVLTVTATGRPGSAFLGHGMRNVPGPLAVTLRVRTPSGGAGKVEWLPPGGGAAGEGPKSVPFELPAGDWKDLTVEVPDRGTFGILRLYLPASTKPVELDWVEVRGKAPGAKPQRWQFDAG